MAGRFIVIEGIDGAGTTTQAQLLADNLRSPAKVVPEFGDHELGRYLRSSGSPGMRLTPEGCETSYVRHLLALCSHMQKLRDTPRSRNTLLDVATLTDTAFALADLPEPAAQELRPVMKAAVNSLIELVHPPAHRGVLIYLDCEPEVAAERLARRNGTEVRADQLDFLRRMRDAYEFLLEDRQDFVRLDANRGIDEVGSDGRHLKPGLFLRPADRHREDHLVFQADELPVTDELLAIEQKEAEERSAGVGGRCRPRREKTAKYDERPKQPSHVPWGVHSTYSIAFRLELSISCTTVEKLCMDRAKAVQKLTGQIFLLSKRPTIPSGGRVDVIFAPRFA